jgi:hypothetical protein
MELAFMASLIEKPLTGEPDAGNPPVRFGGRGEVSIPHPYLYPKKVGCGRIKSLMSVFTNED